MLKKYYKRIFHKIFIIVALYCLLLFSIFLVFGMLYLFMNINNPWNQSLAVLLGNVASNSTWIENLQYFVISLCNIFCVGYMILYLTYPINQVFFEDYFVYDTRRCNLVFRYHLIQRRNRWFYDAKMRVVLYPVDEANDGANVRKALWDSNNANISAFELERIHGDRYLIIDEKSTKEIINIISSYDDKDKLVIDVSVVATNRYGHRNHQNKAYKIRDGLASYMFAPCQNCDYTSRFLIENKEIHDTIEKNNNDIIKKCSFYQRRNMELYFEIENEKTSIGCFENNSIPQNRVIRGKDIFLGKKGKPRLLPNYIGWLIFDNSKIKWKEIIDDYKEIKNIF